MTQIFQPQNNIFRRCEIVHQFEVLMNHPDVKPIRVIRVLDLDRFSFNPDLASVRLIHAE